MDAGECGMGPLGPLFTDLYELTMLAEAMKLRGWV